MRCFSCLIIASLVSRIHGADQTRRPYPLISNQVLSPGPCERHPHYPQTFQCAKSGACLSIGQYNDSICDCCGPRRDCNTCDDHSDEGCFMDHRRHNVNGGPSDNRADQQQNSPTTPQPSTATPVAHRCDLPLAVGLCPSSTNTTARPSSPLLQWYYDSERSECLAFTYFGCGNEAESSNRFKSRMDCSMNCEPMDRVTCAMNTPPHSGGQWINPTSADRSCQNLRCPDGYRCKQGAMRSDATCCSVQLERAYDRAHRGRGLCPANMTSLRRDDEIVVGKSCDTLQCPNGFECWHTSYFGNCCRRTTSAPAVPRRHTRSSPRERPKGSGGAAPQQVTVLVDFPLDVNENQTSPPVSNQPSSYNARERPKGNRTIAQQQQGTGRSMPQEPPPLTNQTSAEYVIVSRPISDKDESTRNSTDTNTTTPIWMKAGKFQGDIAGFEDQDEFDQFVERLNRWANRSQSNRSGDISNSATSDPRLLWPGGRVPYKIDSNSWRLRGVVREAIQDFHTYTCVRFVERTSESSYLNIVDTENQCWSFVGRRSAWLAQNLMLGRGCWTKSTAIHELMHAIGFWHEHQRTDRDRYIRVNEYNIETNCYRKNYKKADFSEMNLIGSYDVRSVMHYAANTECSRNGLPVMSVRSTGSTVMGNDEGMSSEDAKKIRILYKCSNSQSCPSTIAPHWTIEDGFQYSCAAIYDGTHCTGNLNTINTNWAYTDLSRAMMTSRNDWNWDDEIASMVINPYCSVTLCSDKRFQGLCSRWQGGYGGLRVPTISSELSGRASSMYCQCSSDATPATNCQPSVHPYGFDTSGYQRQTCAYVYAGTNCYGNWLWLSAGSKYPDLSDVSMSASHNWDDEIASIALNSRCRIKLCIDTNYRGSCHTFNGQFGGNVHDISFLKRRVSSLVCACD